MFNTVIKLCENGHFAMSVVREFGVKIRNAAGRFAIGLRINDLMASDSTARFKQRYSICTLSGGFGSSSLLPLILLFCSSTVEMLLPTPTYHLDFLKH